MAGDEMAEVIRYEEVCISYRDVPVVRNLSLAPRPRKESPASSIIMVPISSIAVTRIGPKILGRMCRIISVNVEQPEILAASRYRESF